MTIIGSEARETVLLGEFRRRLDDLKVNGLYREFIAGAHRADDRGQTQYGDRRLQVWCSNDYLGLSQHPDVILAQIESTFRHGTGNGGSRNIAGTSASHVELEERLAAWHGKERALIFSSGYVANFESLSTMISAVPDTVVFSDALNHRSLIEGISRTGCRKHVFRHNDADALESDLSRYPLEQPKIIVFETVYSMDGDVAPLSAFLDLAERYNALTFVDETHAIGVRGPTGAGLSEELGDHRATFIQGVFGKAIGTVGGYVAGPDTALDYVRSFAPGFIFTTALPQAGVDATLKGLDLVQRDGGLRVALDAGTRYTKNALRAAGIDFIDADSHLVPVMVPGAERVRRVARRLLDEFGIYVQPINFPSVPRGTERFRVTVAPYRTREQIDYFVQALTACLADA
ncbi:MULTISPECIES: 5-aminolevulinate synthase [unclassified Streptomyces]|uniref:5-aminolevulinate synthase n=1 Tax=unclassified Streptomyces TaxID=2593676 RepID=UPI000DEFFBF6|nr:5-aminolevulinate synthase [Streptomyces sp. Go-475]AXE88796.1 5-aminolevulinate synthase [Streptomyces sp. Go-475]